MKNLFQDECQVLKEESLDEFLQRYKGFGKKLYSEIKSEFPNLFKNLKLFKATESTGKCAGYFPQKLDSYGHYSDENIFFRIYIDPESGVLGIHNYDFSFETGDWSDNPMNETKEFIKNEIIPRMKN